MKIKLLRETVCYSLRIPCYSLSGLAHYRDSPSAPLRGGARLQEAVNKETLAASIQTTQPLPRNEAVFGIVLGTELAASWLP